MARFDWNELVTEYTPMVLRLAMGVLSHREDARDVAQQVFIEFWHDRNQIKNPAGWIYRTTLHQAINWKKSRRSRRSRERDRRTSLSPPLPPEHLVEQEELAQVLKDAVSQLPPRQAQIFLLRHQGELTLAKIGEVLGISTGTVKKQLHRAVTALQKKLKSPGEQL